MKKLFFILGILLIVIKSNQVDAQTVWTFQNNPLPNNTSLGKIQFVSSTEGWISAGNGKLLHTTDTGTTWTIVTPFPNDIVTSMADPSVTMCWINKTNGWKMNWFGTGFNDAKGAVIHKTNDGGNTWSKKVLSSAAGDIGVHIQFVNINNGWVSRYNIRTKTGAILKTTDGGENWNVVSSLPATDETVMFYFTDSNNGCMASVNDNPPIFKILRTTDGGSTWTAQYTDNTPNGDTLSSSGAMQFTDANNGWVVGPNGRILKTNNGGKNWELLNGGIGIYANSKCLFFLNSSTGWIGTNISSSTGIISQRAIINTINGGTSWTKTATPISGSVFSIYFTDSKNGWYTGEECVGNCSGPDSLKIWGWKIAHTTNGSTEVENEQNVIPSVYSLNQNYPNPFNPTTVIRYQIPVASKVIIKVYDLLGRELETLIDRIQDPGNFKVEFDGKNISSGVYFYKINAGNYSSSRKMILIK